MYGLGLGGWSSMGFSLDCGLVDGEGLEGAVEVR